MEGQERKFYIFTGSVTSDIEEVLKSVPVRDERSNDALQTRVLDHSRASLSATSR